MSRIDLDRQLPWLGLVAAVALALFAFDLWWIHAYRHGYPLTIDEAGYIAIGLTDHLGFQNGGLSGWWETIQHQVPQAPLVPALTSLSVSLKAGTLNAFAVLAGFMVLLTFAAYGIGARLAGPRLGALSAIVVATAPGVFSFSREFVFAMAVAAFLSCAVFALLRSDGLRSRRWSMACGLAIGLMLLSRSMTIAFVPALLVTACFVAFVRGRLQGEGDWRNRGINLGLLVLVGFAVAATWYWRNFQPVYDYLTGYGYGSNSAFYGPDHSLLSWARWHDVANRMVYTDLLVPLAVAILLGLAVLLVAAVRRVRDAADRRTALVGLVAGDVFAVALVFAGCYLALTSSRNGGEGFTVPVAMLLPPIAVVALRCVGRRVAAVGLAALALITAVNVVANANVSESFSRIRFVHVPAFGTLPWINGTPQAVSAIRSQIPGPPTRFVAADHGWEEANERLGAFVVKATAEGVHEPVDFASRNYALNTSTLALEGLVDHARSFFLWQLLPEPEDSVRAYAHQLTAPEFGRPGLLVTMSSEAGDFPPLVTQRCAEAAARRTGFHVEESFTLPDGRRLRVWVRREPAGRPEGARRDWKPPHASGGGGRRAVRRPQSAE